GDDPPLIGRIGADQDKANDSGGKDLPTAGIQQKADRARERTDAARDPDAMKLEPVLDMSVAPGRRQQRDREHGKEWPVPAAPARPPFPADRTAKCGERE